MAALWKAEGERAENDGGGWGGGRWLPGVVRAGLSEDVSSEQRIEGSKAG